MWSILPVPDCPCLAVAPLVHIQFATVHTVAAVLRSRQPRAGGRFRRRRGGHGWPAPGWLALLAADPAAWPWPTFIVNIVGAFLLGYFTTRLLERLPQSSYRRPLLGTGLCAVD